MCDSHTLVGVYTICAHSAYCAADPAERLSFSERHCAAERSGWRWLGGVALRECEKDETTACVRVGSASRSHRRTIISRCRDDAATTTTPNDGGQFDMDFSWSFTRQRCVNMVACLHGSHDLLCVCVCVLRQKWAENSNPLQDATHLNSMRTFTTRARMLIAC